VIAAALAVCASATVPDAFGVGARWSGTGGGGVAVVDDGAAAMLNPAGLTGVARPTATVGWTSVLPQMRPVTPVWWDTNRDGAVDSADPPLAWDAGFEAIHGVQVQTARPLGGRAGIGLTAFVPTSTLIRFKTFEPSLPTYVMWDNRLQRYAATAGAAVEVLPGLSLGVSGDLLARARLQVAMTADVSAEITGTGDNLGDFVSDAVVDVHTIDLNVSPTLAPVFGLQWEVGRAFPALDGLRFGAAYHPEIGLPIEAALDIQANLSAAGIGAFEPFVGAAVAEATLALFDHYVPQRLSLGVGLSRSDTLTLYGEVRWTDWRRMTLNIARVQDALLTAPFLDIPPDAIRDGNAHAVLLRSVWSAQVGGELHLPEVPVSGKLQSIRGTIRAGFGYLPTPVVDQAVSSAFLDADRSQFAVGAGLAHWDPFSLVDGQIRYDLFFQANLLANTTLARTTETPLAGFPVDPAAGVPVGGAIWVLGGQWGFDY
jgi:long-subunit fatty acid transport protein